MDFSEHFSSNSPSKPKDSKEKEAHGLKDEHDLSGHTANEEFHVEGGASGAKFEEDLIRDFDQKASELASFLEDSQPPTKTMSGAALGGIDFLTSTSGKSSTDSSPNPPHFNVQTQFMDILGGTGGGSAISSGEFDLIGDFKSAGGDSKITEELMSAAREFSQDSPTAMDMGFEPVHHHHHDGGETEKQHHEISYFEDRIGPPVDDKSMTTGGGVSSTHGMDFHYTQSEPQMMNFGFDERTESPKLPDEPCFKPSPMKIQTAHDFEVDDRFNIEKMSSFSSPEVAVGHHHDGDPHFGDYTRRETMTFSEEKPDPLSLNLENDVPPPIPKHAYEYQVADENVPPPVPKHAESSSQIFQREPPFIHATYDDKIDDEFDDDSLSRPLSHKLSDSLELKESSQREFREMDESLMDLEELSSSKSISPNHGGIPQEMLESTLFSQQPPSIIEQEEDEKFGFTHVAHDVESKPVASIPPFSSETKVIPPNQPSGDFSAYGVKSFEPTEAYSHHHTTQRQEPPATIHQVAPILPETKVEPKREEKKEEVVEEKQKKPKAEPPPRHSVKVSDSSEFEITQEVIQILNTFNPRS